MWIKSSQVGPCRALTKPRVVLPELHMCVHLCTLRRGVPARSVLAGFLPRPDGRGRACRFAAS